MNRDSGHALILEAARDLVGIRGANVTLSEIATRVGLNPASTGCDELVASLLGLRLRDVVALVSDDADQHPAERATSWRETVSEQLTERLDRPSPSLRAVARALAVSPRTLQRRLADEGTNWREVIESVRRTRALELLQQGVSADVVAIRIGYSGSRALRRALGRWEVGA